MKPRFVFVTGILLLVSLIAVSSSYKATEASPISSLETKLLMTSDEPKGNTFRISVDSDEKEAMGYSPALVSNNGTVVIFQSNAESLGVQNGSSLFVRELKENKGEGKTDLLVGPTTGVYSVADISDNGNYIAFAAHRSFQFPNDPSGHIIGVFVFDRKNPSDIDHVSVSADGEMADGDSLFPSISNDGRFVVFQSKASNLVSDDSNGREDIFLYDRDRDKPVLISRPPNGLQDGGSSITPSISSDGTHVAYVSSSKNLVDDDKNETSDVFISELTANGEVISTELISLNSAGEQANALMAGFGQRVAISADGRYVAFSSYASNLVDDDTNGETDVFVRDTFYNETDRVSVSSAGQEGEYLSQNVSISADGRFVVFSSFANNLVDDDSNECSGSSGTCIDVFVHDYLGDKTTRRVSESSNGEQADDNSGDPFISADGRYIVFKSGATNLVADDTNSTTDVFIHELPAAPPDFSDSDGDGLLDEWETDGVTIDPDGNGPVPPQLINLPEMGAHKDRPDIFVQLDWMVANDHNHKIDPNAIRRVVDAFDAAGFALHIDHGRESVLNFDTDERWGDLSRARSLPEVTPLGSTSGNSYNWSDFDDIKNEPGRFTESGRTPIFHYAIAAHNYGSTKSSGISREIPGSDFIVSLGSFGNNRNGTIVEQAGTLMHELGHNLGLCHGGPLSEAGEELCNVNHKPNYLSVMNYSFQTTGVIRDGTEGNIDYSHTALPPLNEYNLDEATGLGPGAANFGTRHFCSSLLPFGLGDVWAVVVDAEQRIDWNCDDDEDDSGVSYNINGEDGDNQQLIGYSDWDHLMLKGGAIGQAGTPPDLPMETEEEYFTPELAERILPLDTDQREIYLPIVVR